MDFWKTFGPFGKISEFGKISDYPPIEPSYIHFQVLKITEKIRGCQNGANAEGYERPFDKNWGPIQKRIFGRKCRFFGPKNPCSFSHDQEKFSK